MKQRRIQQSDLFHAAAPSIELAALQRAEARALLEVLLVEAIGETRMAVEATQREIGHDENNS